MNGILRFLPILLATAAVADSVPSVTVGGRTFPLAFEDSSLSAAERAAIEAIPGSAPDGRSFFAGRGRFLPADSENGAFMISVSNDFERLRPLELDMVDETLGPERTDGLASRLVRFATWLPDHRFGPRRPPALERRNSRRISNLPPPLSDRYSDAELAANADTNAARRAMLLDCLRSNFANMEDGVQTAWMDACDRIWIHPPYYPDGGAKRAAIRREEDGIPSAEALLAWFAENETSCESVRAEAKARLAVLKNKMASAANALSIGEIAAHPGANPAEPPIAGPAPTEGEGTLADVLGAEAAQRVCDLLAPVLVETEGPVRFRRNGATTTFFLKGKPMVASSPDWLCGPDVELEVDDKTGEFVVPDGLPDVSDAELEAIARAGLAKKIRGALHLKDVVRVANLALLSFSADPEPDGGECIAFGVCIDVRTGEILL